MSSTNTTAGIAAREHGVAGALGLAALVIAVEYLARHFVLFWLPELGALRVNDMLVTGVVYVVLVWLTLTPSQRTGAAIGGALRGIAATARQWQVWATAVATVAAVLLLAMLDAVMWGGVQLPALYSPWRWETTLAAGAAPLLVPLSLLAVNGVVVPFAEEWLWRGLIQPRLVGAMGLAGGLVLTSVLFSFKHALVDASLMRALALTGFGLVIGLLAARRGWRAAAMAHALVNTGLTALTLLAGGMQ